MQNRIVRKVAQKTTPAIVKSERTGDVTWTEYSDGSSVMSVDGKMLKCIRALAKHEGVTPEEIMARAVNVETIDAALNAFLAGKAGVA